MGCSFDMNVPGAIKVPIVITMWFWIIKVLCTTVGESAADWLNESVGLGLGGTTLLMAGVLLLSLVGQFYVSKYHPILYWWCVMLISVVGTLVTDLLTDEVGVSRYICIAVFAVAMIATFAGWYYMEKTLSIHSINTFKREFLYWLVILFTFALGTAVGDQIAEGLGLGYWQALLVFAGVVVVVAGLYYFKLFGEVLAFWLTYILTRPLGASLGDLLSQEGDGGLGLGPGITSAIFLTLIVLAIGYLSWFKVDVPSEEDDAKAAEEEMKAHNMTAENENTNTTDVEEGVKYDAK